MIAERRLLGDLESRVAGGVEEGPWPRDARDRDRAAADGLGHRAIDGPRGAVVPLRYESWRNAERPRDPFGLGRRPAHEQGVGSVGGGKGLAQSPRRKYRLVEIRGI